MAVPINAQDLALRQRTENLGDIYDLNAAVISTCRSEFGGSEKTWAKLSNIAEFARNIVDSTYEFAKSYPIKAVYEGNQIAKSMREATLSAYRLLENNDFQGPENIFQYNALMLQNLRNGFIALQCENLIARFDEIANLCLGYPPVHEIDQVLQRFGERAIPHSLDIEGGYYTPLLIFKSKVNKSSFTVMSYSLTRPGGMQQVVVVEEESVSENFRQKMQVMIGSDLFEVGLGFYLIAINAIKEHPSLNNVQEYLDGYGQIVGIQSRFYTPKQPDTEFSGLSWDE